MQLTSLNDRKQSSKTEESPFKNYLLNKYAGNQRKIYR